MKTSRKGDVVKIELSAEEACLLVANLAATRDDKMIELMERLIGSPQWKLTHQPKDAHEGVLDARLYNEVVERAR